VKENKHDKALVEWLKGGGSSDDLKKEISENDFEGYSSILNEVDSWTVADDDLEFDKLLSKRNKRSKVVAFPIWKYAAAASVLFALSIFYFTFSSKNIQQYATSFGETKEIVLPDGSIATLNSSSTVSIDLDAWKKNRVLNLTGQCYFEVKKGKPFTVHLSEGLVQVLGTTLEIKSREKGFRTKCFSGRVAVQNLTNDRCVLTKGFQANSTKQGVFKMAFSGESPDWMSGVYIYDSEELDQVLEDLRFEYGLIINGTIQKKKFTGKLPKDDLETTLRMLFTPLGIPYRVEGNQVFLI
jgi:transmembrane sensor